ncbi:MAG: hypothetical protein K2X48_02290 [Chitinophagaceae bacterium]|nr:hypothetical protein [Chitinophagaceae bacterium]
MRKLSILMGACLMASFALMAQVKPVQKKAEVKIPQRVEVLPVKPGVYKKPVPPAATATFKKNNSKPFLYSGAPLQKIKVPLPSSVMKKNRMDATPSLFLYNPLTASPPHNNTVQRGQSICDNIVLTRQSQLDSFALLFPGCTTVGNLTINGTGASPAITNLSALSSITKINNNLRVIRTGITNLSALSALTQIGDTLRIERNTSLTSIGLNNLSVLGGLYLLDLPALTSVNGLNNNLTKIGGGLFIDSVNVSSLAGLAGITRVNGDVSVSHTPLSTLNPLNSLKTINGYLALNSNNQLTSIGINNLDSTFGFLISDLPLLTNLGPLTYNLKQKNITAFWLISMPALTSLSGLDSLHSTAVFYIWICNSITSLNGLNQLQGNVPFTISLWANPNLTDITALQNITAVSNGKFEINDCSSLSNLNGIQNINNMGALWLTNLPLVNNLSVLNTSLTITNSNNDSLRIFNNPLLAACAVPAICNYLNSGAGGAEIHDNAAGCASLQDVLLNCTSTCAIDSVTWNGDVSNAWNDSLNWTPHKVPLFCTKVIIPSGTPNDPALYSNVFIGGLVMNGSYLYLNNYNLTVTKTIQLDNAGLYNGSAITINRAMNPKINASYIEGTFNCSDYSGNAAFTSNTFTDDVTLSDSTGRSDYSFTYFNTFNKNFTLINNSDYGNNYLSNASPFYDYVTGNLTIVNNSAADISVGLGDGRPLKVQGNFIVNASNGRVDINNLTFVGGTFNPHTTQLGANPIKINNLFMESGAETRLDQPVEINNSLVFDNGSNKINTTATNLLILNNGATVSRDPLNNRGFVNGPLKKRGNQAFTFPTGKYEFLLGGDLYAPITISAPANITDEFTAEYFRRNPSIDGYDTSLYTPGFGSISGREYWQLNRTSGASNVTVTLSYDSARSGAIFDLSKAQVAGWDGAKWISWLNGGVTGNVAKGTIQSASPLTNYGPLTISSKPIRKPVITIGTVDTVPCIGQTFMVRFTLDTNMVAGNTFRVELSDTLGNFNASFNPTIGSKISSSSDSILATMPLATFPFAGKPYRIRVVGNLPRDTSVNAPVVRPLKVPQTAFTITGADTVCIGTGPAKFYPSQKEPGATYTWNVAGGSFNVINDTAFVTWVNPSTYSISLTSSNKCGAGSSATRGVVVRPGAPLTAPVLTNTGRWLYANVLPPNTTGYRWYRNDTLIGSAVNSSYYASAAGVFTVRFYNSCGNSVNSNSISFAAASIPQTITFNAIPDKVYGDAPFSISASSSSNLPLSFQLVSGPGNLTAGVYTITTTGTVTIRATQSGDNVYDTAAPVTRTFTINKASQSITFNTLPDFIFGVSVSPFQLNASASSGNPLNYTLSGSAASLSGNIVTVNSLGTVSITASQAGDTNYLPASPVTRSFCVRVNDLTNISGSPFVCPGQTATYSINNVSGLTYNWRLSNGTNYSSTTNSVAVTWGAAGTYTLIVSATGPCGAATANDSLTVNVINPVSPGAVSNMLPADGSSGLQLPLTLSWLPGSNALTYDLFVWDSATAQPAVPYAANITGISYTLPKNAFAYNKTYNWRVVSKNACLQTNGAVQRFRLRPLPDLIVSEVLAPATATSGQTITISWKVRNGGPGNTTTNQSWTDAVFLSFDTLPNFNLLPDVNPGAWSQLSFPVRPLLIGTRTNVTALDSGQQYSNSINFTLPLNYAQPLYAYVITNYPAGPNPLLQMTYANDTARAINPVNVTASPTPDLRVDSVFTPASVFSGSTINITYKVKNYGALTPAGSGWTDKFYISPSPLFNINNAVLVKAPKISGSYYPNAIDAAVFNNLQLQQDSFVTKSTSIVIPNFISGTWFLHVFTNATGTLYEGAFANNNINNSVAQVFLTPTPQLTINSLTVPFTTASTTQPVGINWNIFNAGFRDNIEKNKGHYFVPVKCANDVPGYADSLGFGGSYWVDRVYLSTDANGLNIPSAVLLGEVPQGILNSGLTSPDGILPTVCNPPNAPAPINTVNVLNPGSNHPKNFNFNIPADLPQGNYYIYVYTNPDKTVFEFPDTPSIRRSVLPITVQRPDLSVPAVTVPSNTTGAQQFSISYNVQNNGPGTVFNALRRDRIFVSSSPVFDVSAQLVNTVSFTENLPVAVPVSHTVNYTFPPGTSGTRYFYVQTNFDSLFRETTYTNNISAAAATVVSTAVPADLVITNFQMPDSVFAPANNFISYSITNNGAAAANGTCTDSIFISCSPVYNAASSYFVGTRTQNRNLLPGASVKDSFNLNLGGFSYNYNNCFPVTNSSTAYFFVKANATNTIYEGSNTANNTAGSGGKLLVNLHVDHIVTTVAGADSTIAGRPYPVTWTVKNIGQNPGRSVYASWYDGIYFSTDSVFNANAKLATEFFINSVLNKNETYTETLTATVPNLPTGNYYVFAFTNYNNAIGGEINRTNNTNLIRNASGAAKKIYVVQPILPDLVDSIIAAPSTIATGQPLTIAYRITNNGAGVTYPDNWSNEVWLSTDFIPGNAGDIRLSSKNRNTTLLPGGFYNDTVTAQVPLNIAAGNYILIAVADAGGAVIESNDTNNLAFKPITVFVPPATDLIVQSVNVPDTVYLGYTIDTAKWVIRNNSSNTANGASSDGIYLSKNAALDSSAVLLDIRNKIINMPPLSNDTITMRPLVTNVIEGTYNVLVKTDILNNIVETNKLNNTGAAVKNIYVKVKELLLNVTENNTLQNISRYYKLRIPDSLRDATILVTLKTADSLTMRNEMYISAGYVPSPARFDYRFETPNYGNQQIVMSSVTDSVYYIAIRCASSNPVLQNIALKAVKLPFAILNVQSNTGGNGGNVTVKISGSLFANNMKATLSKPGTTITASNVFFVNSATVFATFPLQGRPIGVYDLTLTKQDSTVATLAGGFSIVSPNNGGLITGGGVNTGPTGPGTDPGCDPGADAGLNSQLVTEISVPEKVFTGWPFTIQINFSNPTNMDIPAQVRVLYNDKNVPMALTQAGLASATATLYLQLTEPGGPPGIIRAGGGGTIIIYSKAPLSTPGHTFVKVYLK